MPEFSTGGAQTFESAIIIHGVEEVARNLELIGRKVKEKILRRALKASAKPMEEEIQRRAYRAPGGPTRPAKGHFADHIGVTTSIRKTGQLSVKVGPEKGYEWARFIEYGTPQFGALPFMRESYRAAEQAVYNAFEEELWDGIKQELRSLGLS
jgi:HK97 gp10 family phage protein